LGLTLKCVVAGAVVLGFAACSGARHRKVAGPPPEYERPDDPGAYEAGDGGLAGAREGGSEFMLISPDAGP
jgi:hypothetical protein